MCAYKNTRNCRKTVDKLREEHWESTEKKKVIWKTKLSLTRDKVSQNTHNMLHFQWHIFMNKNKPLANQETLSYFYVLTPTWIFLFSSGATNAFPLNYIFFALWKAYTNVGTQSHHVEELGCHKTTSMRKRYFCKYLDLHSSAVSYQ